MEHESSSTSSSTSNFSYGSNSPSTITHKRNSGRKKFKETRHPIYQGVRQRNGGKWVCEMRVPNSKNNSRLWLGTYDTPEMAARAYDVAALALKGKSAQLNFDDSVWVLQRAKSTSLSDIRSAAHEAAHSFRSTSTSSPLSPNSSVVLPAQSPENIDSIFSPSSNSSIFLHVESSENVVETSTMFVNEETSMTFLDEEAMFNMPTLLASMAEGMLLTPPALQTGFRWDDFDYNTQDLSLWID